MVTVSFESDIMPLFKQFAGPMRWRLDLTKYEDVKSNADLIHQRLLPDAGDDRMPPAPFDPLTAEQIDLYEQWMAQGYPP